MAKKKSKTKKKTTRRAPARRTASTTRRKTTTRKTATRKKAPARRKVAASDRPRTKSQIFTDIAEVTELSRKEVASVFDAMSDIMQKDLGNRGPGVFTVPGLMKVVKQHKPRRPAKKNVPNPFRPGELMDVKARPASNVVKVRPLKKLKEMV